MKLLLIPDLHGKKPFIPKEEFDAIVCIGDVCSDKGIRKYKNVWMKRIEKGEKISIDKVIIEKIGRRGMNKLDRFSLNEGRGILKYLDSFGKPVFFIPGNWDQSYGDTKIKDMDKNDYNYRKAFYDYWLGDKLNKKLVKGLRNIIDCQFKLHSFKGINFIGYGLSSAPEKIRKGAGREYTKKQEKMLKEVYQKIINKLDETYKKRNKKLPTIFLTHNVPYNTKLDVLRIKGSEFNGKHFGSTVAREFVLKHKPMLCVGGHMHEHFGKCKLGETICVNVGFGGGKAVMVEISNGNKLEGIRFIEGKREVRKKSM